MEGCWLYSRVGGQRVAARFHLFVSHVDQQNEGTGCVQDYLA